MSERHPILELGMFREPFLTWGYSLEVVPIFPFCLAFDQRVEIMSHHLLFFRLLRMAI